MYAHEIFKSYHNEDWQKSFYGQLIEGYHDSFKSVLQGINDATKFHMGRQTDVNFASGGEHALEDVFSQCHFPYDNCWFDYVSDAKVDSPASRRHGLIPGHVRSALLCTALYDGLYTVNHFTAIDSPDSWTMDPITTFVGNKPLDRYELIRNTLPPDAKSDGYVMTCVMKPTAKAERFISEMSDELVYNAGSDISTLSKFLRLLNCKNSVFQEVVVKNKPLKDKRAKRDPGSFKYSYKLLRLDLGKAHGGTHSLGEIKHLWSNPLHSCRGHFKTYTPDSRLFGKYIGTFWFPPHIRGSKEVGVVKKEYEMVNTAIKL